MAEDELEKLDRELADSMPTELECMEAIGRAIERLIDIGWEADKEPPDDGAVFVGIVAGLAIPVDCYADDNGYFVRKLRDGITVVSAEPLLAWRHKHTFRTEYELSRETSKWVVKQ